MRLSGKVALVTGAAYGLGYSVALRFAEEGAIVIVTDPKLFRLEFRHESIIPMRLDVANKGNWFETVNSIQTRFGRLDILFLNEGSMTSRRFSLEMAQTCFCLGINAVLPVMQQCGGGIIFNVLSICSDAEISPDLISLGFQTSGVPDQLVDVRFNKSRPTEIINACLFIKDDHGRITDTNLIMDEGHPIQHTNHFKTKN